MEKHKITKRHYIAWSFLLILAYLIFSSNTKNKLEQANKKEDLSVQAFVICKNLVKEKLLSPTTANFPLLERRVWNRIDKGYKIRSYVESQNEYGVTIKTNWNCYMRYKGSGKFYDPINWEHELEFI